jgi:tetratricopeptide (TPR) repeat protein
VIPDPDQVQGSLWRTDPITLREIVLDREALWARLDSCPALERVWILSLLGQPEEAIRAGHALAATARDRLLPLLVLARAYQRQYAWHEAARIHEEALQLAGTRVREAMIRYQIGRRLFDEARYREAAAEFEWARDLYRTSNKPGQMVRTCQDALDRARELLTGL